MTVSAIQFESVAPQFVVADVVRAAEYYRDVFGFEITGYFLDPPVHAIVRRGSCEVFFAKAEGDCGLSNRRLKPAAIDAYFRIKGLDDFAREVSNRGAKILDGPVTRVY
ncbi:MAG: VOC family protein, partial [Blastocatellia bacterium]